MNDTYSHIVWLLKLNKKQLVVIRDIIKQTGKTEYWEGVNKYNIRGLIESLAKRVDEFGD